MKADEMNVQTRGVCIRCICGRNNEMKVVGDNNADGKCVCVCGRHITVHLRRRIKPKGGENSEG